MATMIAGGGTGDAAKDVAPELIESHSSNT